MVKKEKIHILYLHLWVRHYENKQIKGMIAICLVLIQIV